MYYKKIANEEVEYIEQYHNAVNVLLYDKEANKHCYPIINLIHQVMENNIKYYIAESAYNQKTYKELKIDNCHNLEVLLNNDNLKKYFSGIKEFENNFEKFSDIIKYFYKILGENTFLNSRYFIQKDKNEIKSKKYITIEELRNVWVKYCEIADTMQLMYTAFVNAMIVIYFERNNYMKEIVQFEKEIINGFKEIGLNDERITKIMEYMNKYVERNEYYDYYVENDIICN